MKSFQICWLAVTLLLVLCLGLVSCGFSSGASQADTPASVALPPRKLAQPPEPQSTPEPEEPYVSPNINILTGLERPEGMLPDQRPVAVMVANNQQALPQRGLAAADVMYEMLTEGGITRLMAMYADYTTMPQVGPVRSTRDQFLQFALPQDAILAHIGSSPYARNLLALLDYDTVDGFHLGTTAYWFDVERSRPKPLGKLNEYCWFTDAALLWNGLERADVLTTGETWPLFQFSSQPPEPSLDAYAIALRFSDLSVTSFDYGGEGEGGHIYYKNHNNAPHYDEDGSRLTYTNVIILEADIGLKDDGMSSDFDLSGGTGWYFTAGGQQPLVWEKGAPEDRLKLTTPKGELLNIQPGKSYIGILPAENADALTVTPFVPQETALPVE